MTRHTGLIVGMLFLAHVAAAQSTPQWSKLVGSGAVGHAAQGSSVAITPDGDTAIVGGWDDNSGAGAAWVYTHSGGVWTQQGSKLVGTGAVGIAQQGQSVAISADGNTAIVGGPGDSSSVGAAWVFTRSGGVWSQQGSKLVGSGALGFGALGQAAQGYSVAISADGNTAIVGGPGDNPSNPSDPGSAVGAAWVFTRSGGVWSQQGSKLVDIFASAGQGCSVAISADGNTALVGSFGGAHVFTRSGGTWSVQPAGLVGSGSVGAAYQGQSVAISADGNAAIVGGPGDNSAFGAAWVFTRNGGVWSQQGSKLVGGGSVGVAYQGYSVAISGDGNTAIIGGPGDNPSNPSDPNSGAGAAWIFTGSGGAWSQQGSKLASCGAVGAGWQGWSVAISGDGSTAILGSPNDNNGIGDAWVFVPNGCAAPCVTGQPESQGVQSGQSAVLSVTATGPGPLSYQWYLGFSGDISTPVGSNATSFTTPALAASTSYWVRVSNICGHGDSGTATVSVSCIAPSITSQPQSQSIVSGQTATLAVIATGAAPLSYRWYQGNARDTSTPVGANASTFTTPPLDSTTTYWVWVFNACGTADSATATITVERRVRRHLRRAM